MIFVIVFKLLMLSAGATFADFIVFVAGVAVCVIVGHVFFLFLNG